MWISHIYDDKIIKISFGIAYTQTANTELCFLNFGHPVIRRGICE